MEVNELKSHIKLNTVPNFLVFTGEEVEIAKLYRRQISKVTGLEIVNLESVSEVYKKLKSPSFVSNNYCYVVFEDMDFIKDERLQKLVQDKLNKNILIVQYSKIDKRSKFFKDYDSVDFAKLDGKMLGKYVKRECNLTDSNIDKLISICENDYSRILLEIDKINRLSGNANDNLDYLLKEKAIYIPPYDAIFDFTDNVLRKKAEDSFNKLKICYDYGENTLALLSALYLNTKQVLQVQTCISSDISKSTGLTAWQVKCSKDKSGYYTDNQLIKLLQLITKTEQDIKLGNIEDELAIPTLLVKLFGGICYAD